MVVVVVRLDSRVNHLILFDFCLKEKFDAPIKMIRFRLPLFHKCGWKGSNATLDQAMT